MKLFFASQPQWDPYVLAVKHKYILLSYQFLKVKFREKEKAHKYLQQFKDAGMEVMIDSAAHTLQKAKTVVDYQKFFESYQSWLSDNIEFIDHYVELDIENVVGLDKVNKWSESLTQELPIPPIRVWHRWRGGVDVWEQMTEQYDYIGFSGFLISQNGGAELPLDQIAGYLKIAQNNNCKVHAFGFTRPRLMIAYPFYSVDSSSWMAPQRYASLNYFDGKMLQAWGCREIKRKLGVNISKLNYKKSIAFSALQWKLYADYLEALHG